MSLKIKIIILLLCLIIGAEGISLITLAQEKNEAVKLNEVLAEEIESLESKVKLAENLTAEPIGNHVVTFYTHTGNRTATGVYPKAGRTVAVDTRYIPHGTVLYIEGIGLRIAEDTGGDIKGNRLDVFVDTKDEAIKKGVKKLKVHVIKEGKK